MKRVDNTSRNLCQQQKTSFFESKRVPRVMVQDYRLSNNALFLLIFLICNDDIKYISRKYLVMVCCLHHKTINAALYELEQRDLISRLPRSKGLVAETFKLNWKLINARLKKSRKGTFLITMDEVLSYKSKPSLFGSYLRIKTRDQSQPIAYGTIAYHQGYSRRTAIRHVKKIIGKGKIEKLENKGRIYYIDSEQFNPKGRVAQMSPNIINTLYHDAEGLSNVLNFPKIEIPESAFTPKIVVNNCLKKEKFNPKIIKNCFPRHNKILSTTNYRRLCDTLKYLLPIGSEWKSGNDKFIETLRRYGIDHNMALCWLEDTLKYYGDFPTRYRDRGCSGIIDELIFSFRSGELHAKR